MKIAVAGATGTAGRPTVEELRRRGHDVVPLNRADGVDLVTGRGLDSALEGVDAVIDVANQTTLSAKRAIAFFEAATGNLLGAARRHGVGHYVLLSVVGVDRMPHDYYAGKLAQERLVEGAALPTTTVRATQFHGFAGQLFERAKAGPVHLALRGRVQPVAAAEVAAHLADLVEGEPQTSRGRAKRHSTP